MAWVNDIVIVSIPIVNAGLGFWIGCRYKDYKQKRFYEVEVPREIKKEARILKDLERRREAQDYGRKYLARPDASPPATVHRNVFKAGHRRHRYGPPPHM